MTKEPALENRVYKLVADSGTEPGSKTRFVELKWDSDANLSDLGGFCDQRKLPEDYGNFAEFSWVNGQGEWPDFGSGHMEWVLVSAKFREVLLDLAELPDVYQFLAPRFSARSLRADHMGYKLMHLRDHRRCVDLNKSGLAIDEHGGLINAITGTDTSLRNAFFHAEPVRGTMHLFRSMEFTAQEIVSPELRAELAASDLLGFTVVTLGTFADLDPQR